MFLTLNAATLGNSLANAFSTCFQSSVSNFLKLSAICNLYSLSLLELPSFLFLLIFSCKLGAMTVGVPLSKAVSSASYLALILFVTSSIDFPVILSGSPSEGIYKPPIFPSSLLFTPRSSEKLYSLLFSISAFLSETTGAGAAKSFSISLTTALLTMLLTAAAFSSSELSSVIGLLLLAINLFIIVSKVASGTLIVTPSLPRLVWYLGTSIVYEASPRLGIVIVT